MGCGSSKENPRKSHQTKDVHRPVKPFPRGEGYADAKFKLPSPVFEYFKALFLRNAAPPKVAKPTHRFHEGASAGKLPILPLQKSVVHQSKAMNLGSETETAGPPTALATGVRSNVEAIENRTQPYSDLKPISEENAVGSSISAGHAASAGQPQALDGKVIVKDTDLEEAKQPIIAFGESSQDTGYQMKDEIRGYADPNAVQESEMSDARYSPEPPKVEDYADEDDEPTFADVKLREARLAKEREAQIEAARRAEALRIAEEAALAERQGKLSGMSEAAQNILSKYS